MRKISRFNINIHQRPENNDRRKNFVVFGTLIILLGGGIFWLFFARAATAYDINSVGSINSASLTTNTGASVNGTTVPFNQSIFIYDNLNITLHNVGQFANGDEIDVPITAGANSVYQPDCGSLVFPFTYVGDANGNQFTFACANTSNGINLRIIKTANTPVGGDMTFDLLKNTSNKYVVSAYGINNYQTAGSSTVNIGTSSWTFANTAKNQSPMSNYGHTIAQGSSYTNNGNYWWNQLYVQAVYDYLLQNPTAGEAELLANFGSAIYQNNVFAQTVSPVSGSITSAKCDADSTPARLRKSFYDINDAHTSLIYSFQGTTPNNTWAVMNVVNAPNDTPLAALETLAAAPNTCAISRNTDGSFGIVENFGPIVGSPDAYTDADITFIQNYLAKLPTSAANIAANVQLLQRARDLKLAPEQLIEALSVVYSDVNVNESSSVAGSDGNVGATPSATTNFTQHDTPPTTLIVGQTAIKQNRYTLGGVDLGSADTYFGWPTDNNSAQTPTSPLSVSPVAMAGYQPSTDQTELQAFANANFAKNGFADASTMLTQIYGSATFANPVSYPTVASGVGTKQIFVVYDFVVAPSLSLTTTSGDGDVQLNPSNGFRENSTVNIKTDSADGYEIFLTMANGSADNALHNGAFLLTAGDLTSVNSWGVKLAGNSAFSAVPVSASDQSLILANKASAATGAGDNYTETFGANVGPTTPSGIYSGQVLYTAIVNP